MNWFFANGIRDYGCLVTTWGADYPDPSANLDPLLNIANIDIADEPYYVYNHTKGFAAFNKGWTLGDMSYTCARDWNFKDIVYNG